MHSSKPIPPTALAEGGGFGRVYNRKARRGRQAEERRAARRAARKIERLKRNVKQRSRDTEREKLIAEVQDRVGRAVARDFENELIERGVAILDDIDTPLATSGQPGERRVHNGVIYEWIQDGTAVHLAGDTMNGPVSNTPADGVLYHTTPDGHIGAPACRAGLSGREVDGKVVIDGVGLFPLGEGQR